jgi:hypothetical protein
MLWPSIPLCADADISQLIQMIALKLDSDQDLRSFRLVTQHVANATSDLSFWRIRFGQKFDLQNFNLADSGFTNFRDAYADRMRILYPYRGTGATIKLPDFHQLKLTETDRALAVVRDLIVGKSLCEFHIQLVSLTNNIRGTPSS